MDFSELPQELIELIAGYLSLKDICSCSAVSTRWRNAFDSNTVWKRFCTFHPKYFDVQINKLECTEGIDFYSGCEARERFFKELFVRRNLVKNKSSCEVMGDDFFIDSVLDTVDDLGNYWLFCSCMEGRRCANQHFLQVWNLNDTPFLHTRVQTPLGRAERRFDSKMKIIADKLIFIYDDIVLVYLFAPPHYELRLLYQFSLNSTSSSTSDIKTIVFGGSNIIRISESRDRLIPTPSVSVQAEVWNKEGDLIFAEIVRNSIPEVDELHSYRLAWEFDGFHVVGNDLDRLTIGVKLSQSWNNLGFCVRVFNVQSLQFMKYTLHKFGDLRSVDMSGTIFCLCYSQPFENKHVYIVCYNSDNGQTIYETILSNVLENDIYISTKLTSAGELIVFIKNNVHVYNIKSKSKIIDFYVHSKVLNVTILTRNLFLLECKGYRITHRYGIWNFKTGKKLYNLDYSKGYRNKKLTFSFIQNYVPPPKLIAASDSDDVITTSKVFVTSFW